MNNTTYRFISDPSHGWLEVPIDEIYELGIANKISSYSYKYKNNAYLEEDRDYSIFLQAKNDKNEPFEYINVFQENTPIRGFQSWIK